MNIKGIHNIWNDENIHCGFSSSCYPPHLRQPTLTSSKSLGIEQGFIQQLCIGITQDKRYGISVVSPPKKGWISLTETRFITYYKEEQSSSVQSITGNELNEVYADPVQPVIWIATQRAGLNAYNYETQSFQRLPI